jgi:hypothetical protein
MLINSRTGTGPWAGGRRMSQAPEIASDAVVQKNIFAGESFVDLADCRERAEIWCKTNKRQRAPPLAYRSGWRRGPRR